MGEREDDIATKRRQVDVLREQHRLAQEDYQLVQDDLDDLRLDTVEEARRKLEAGEAELRDLEDQ